MDLCPLSFWISKCPAFSVFVFRAGIWATIGDKCLWEERRVKEKKKQGDKIGGRGKKRMTGSVQGRKGESKSYWNEKEKEEIMKSKEKLIKSPWEWEQLCPESSDAKGWPPLLLASLCLPWGPDSLLPMADCLAAPTGRIGWVAHSHGQLIAGLYELDSRFLSCNLFAFTVSPSRSFLGHWTRLYVSVCSFFHLFIPMCPALEPLILLITACQLLLDAEYCVGVNDENSKVLSLWGPFRTVNESQ